MSPAAGISGDRVLASSRNERLKRSLHVVLGRAAPCYRSSSVVVLSVGLSVGTERVFWKNGWLDRDAVWLGGLGWSKELCIRCGYRFSEVRAIFRENGAAHCNV